MPLYAAADAVPLRWRRHRVEHPDRYRSAGISNCPNEPEPATGQGRSALVGASRGYA